MGEEQGHLNTQTQKYRWTDRYGEEGHRTRLNEKGKVEEEEIEEKIYILTYLHT